MDFEKWLCTEIEQHDKGIRNGAIEEFFGAIKNHYKIYKTVPGIEMLEEIAERLKDK